MIKLNDKEMTVKEALEYLDDPTSVVQKASISFENDRPVSDKPPTVEGFDITADFFVEMYERSVELNADVTATFERCGKLGNKTVVIIVKD